MFESVLSQIGRSLPPIVDVVRGKDGSAIITSTRLCHHIGGKVFAAEKRLFVHGGQDSMRELRAFCV
jgi:hypothetical protein